MHEKHLLLNGGIPEAVRIYLDYLSTQKLVADHLHHILPRCLFPEFSCLKTHPWNGIYLQESKHVKAHKLLMEAFPHSAKLRMAWLFMSGTNWSPSGSSWYTDGISETLLWAGDDIPMGFESGRLATPNTQGNIWVHQGGVRRSIDPTDLKTATSEGFQLGMGEVDRSQAEDTTLINNGLVELRVKLAEFEANPKPGFQRGRLPENSKSAVRSGYVWCNDGAENRQTLTSQVPVGYVLGKLELKPRKAYPTGKKWYNDGTRAVQVYSGEPIPDGFVPGRLQSHCPKGRTLTEAQKKAVADSNRRRVR